MPLRRRLTRAAVRTATVTAVLAIASPAWASSIVPLNPAHAGATAGTFQQECQDPKFGTRPTNQDGWHFVLPTRRAGDFQSLTLTFKDTSGVSVTVPNPTDPYTDFLSANGGGDKQVKHAYLFTPAGWTLTGGSAQVSGEGDKFNLSHTCAGAGTTASPTPTTPTTPITETPTPAPTTDSPTPTTPTPTTPVTSTPTGSLSPSESVAPGGSASTPGGAGGGDNGGSLPLTGVAVTSIALGGVALIGGGALLMMRRRRDRITFTS
ncbi:LPXTG cell wall anchor domain-containing protein [Micromonospora parva]|uniref:LPXTG cell wall anchor domain-containing protein n=1 Tax=Micromonospora parva TaxID=1464048 RepID=UPI003404ED9E